MASNLDIAFADMVATLEQCAEASRRKDGRATLNDIAECVTSAAKSLVADIRNAASPVHPIFAPALAAMAPPPKCEERPDTFIAVSPNGYLHETEIGQTRETVVKDIAVGEFEVSRVFRLRGVLCEDVTKSVAEEVMEAIRSDRFGTSGFIPSIVGDLFPAEAEELRLSFMSPAEIRAERDEANADRAYDEMRDRMMEAAE